MVYINVCTRELNWLHLFLSLSLSHTHTHTHTQELWIEYVRLQCSELLSKLSAASQDGRGQDEEGEGESQASLGRKDKGQMFFKAMTSSNSYAVGLEVCKNGLADLISVAQYPPSPSLPLTPLSLSLSLSFLLPSLSPSLSLLVYETG